MKSEERKSAREKLFLLVSMTTLIFVTMAMATAETLEENQQNPNQTKVSADLKMAVSETGKNLTLDFDSGDLAFEAEKTKHHLVIIYDHTTYTPNHFVECRGENIKSMSAISCDSVESCEKHKSCLVHKSECKSTVTYGRKCTKYETGEDISSYYRPVYYNDYDADTDKSSSSCFRVKISFYSGNSGIVQCTSEEAGVNVTTFDHYTIRDSKVTLLSTIKNVTSDLIQMKLYVPSLAADLIGNAALEGQNVTLYVDEEVISLECNAPKLLFHSAGLLIRVYKKNGSIMESVRYKTSYGVYDEFMRAELRNVKVTTDMIAFSCSAQKLNSSGQWLENRVKVTVQDFPPEMVVKSSDSRTLSVNLTSGAKTNLHCEIQGPQKQTIQRKIRKMADNSNWAVEPKSQSMIEFLRFYQMAGENLICTSLDEMVSKSASANSVWETEHEKCFEDEQKFHFIFNLGPFAPKISKPRNPNPNPNSPNSRVHLIYHEDFADQTLSCNFNGDPEPVIKWLKNGQELFATKFMAIRGKRNETIEYAKLRLDESAIQLSDFDQDENGQAGHVNFSCIASNRFGSDRLDFIITLSEEFTFHQEKPSTTTTTNTNTILFVTIFFALSFISLLIFFIYWKKRATRIRSIESGRILTLQNHVEIQENQLAQ